MTWLSDMEAEKRDQNITVENLCFYFDAVQQDALDLGRTSLKSSKVLALRQKLLALPEPEFNAAIKTIEKLVDDALPQASPAGFSQRTRREALELFERTADGGSRKPTQPVSRV